MSKDIRHYFTVKKDKKLVEEDSDVIPESPDVAVNKKKQSRKRRQIADDSDEEIFSTNKKSNHVTNKNQVTKNKKSPSKATLKEVQLFDVLGSASIKRSEPLVNKSQKTTETGIHSDDDFEKSLLQLDDFKEVTKSQPSEKECPSITPNKSQEKEKLIDQVEIKKLNGYLSKNTEQINKDEKSTEDKKKTVKQEKINKKRKNNETSNYDEQTLQKNLKKEKKDLSEFLEIGNEELIDTTTNTKEQTDEPKQKKRKLDNSFNDSVLTDEERHERKRYSAALYQKYLNRSGPKHLGAKEIPEGKCDCFQGCAFLLTGVLESFERDEIVAAVTKYGGVVKNSISKKVTHVLAGDDAGPAKLAKAEELGIQIINENEFLKMIAESKHKPTSKDAENKSISKKDKNGYSFNKDKQESKVNGLKKLNKSNDRKKNDESHVSNTKRAKTVSPSKEIITPAKKEKTTSPKKEKALSPQNQPSIKNEPKNQSRVEAKDKVKIDEDVEKTNVTPVNTKVTTTSEPLGSSLMWVDKYKPQNIKQIIGQHGEASNVKKLSNWLLKWYSNRKAKLPKPSPWAKNDDGGYYRAALLSGPPGIGKTTTVSLVCKELGFDTVEFNASDTRSKTLIREQIGELLSTTSLSGYAKGITGKGAVTKKHVLVMDEVDGMAGNEDRGGLQELISLIKSSSVPVICTCNDRNSEKMRTLANYCYDLRFSRPRVEQIKAALMSICFREGVQIPSDVVSRLVVAAGQDVRQSLHLLSMWAADAHTSADQLRDETKRMKKDVKVGPWEAIRKVFSAEEHKTMSIHDKSDLFFADYSLAPLFVQENYLNVLPHCPKHELLERFSQAADSISLGDLVEARIRGSQAWNLLPIQAMYSSVIPGQRLAGHAAGQIQFPGWLGKNSRAGKMKRLCQEIHAHTRLSTSGSKSSIYLDYATHLRDAIVTPLIKERTDGIAKSLEVLESYHLLRDDLDSLTELSLWPGQRNPMVLIDSKVKAAMTRAYNKTATALPYAPGVIKKARAQDEDTEESQMDNEASHDDSDPENDALIKKKKKEADKPGPSKSKSNSTKDKKKKK